MHATRTRVYVCVYVDGQVFMHTPHSDLVFSEMKLVTPQQKKHAAQRCQQSVSTMPAAAVYIIIIFLYLFHWPVGKAGYRYRQTNAVHTPTQYTRHNSWPAKTSVGMWNVQPATYPPLPPPSPHIIII